MDHSGMSWYEIPSSARGAIIGFCVGLFLSSLNQPGLGVTAFVAFSLIGIVADAIRYGWKFYLIWTRECAWCSRRITPFTRNRLLSRDIKGSKHWYCSPRCYTEWHRRHYTDRKLFNVLNEGSPLVSVSQG